MVGAQNVISYANSHTELNIGFKGLEITDDPEVRFGGGAGGKH